MSDGSVTYTLEGPTAVVRMDDGKANALSDAMIDALLAALARAEREASALVLAGRTDRFSGGFDLRPMISDPASACALLRHGADLLLALYATPLPLVIACTGHALAAGALLVLTGDVRIGAEGAFKIGLNEVSLGLPVPMLAMELARDRIAPTELPRATLQAQIYTPDEAVRAGYLDAVVPVEGLLDRARADAARLGAFGRSAYGATKERLRGRTVRSIRENLDQDIAALMALPG